jgi:hypothetical protein
MLKPVALKRLMVESSLLNVLDEQEHSRELSVWLRAV